MGVEGEKEGSSLEEEEEVGGRSGRSVPLFL